MKREKSLKCVLSFSSLADALAVESAAREHGLAGRIIPTPGEVAAGCGHAWAAPAGEREGLVCACERLGLAYEDVHEIWMY